MLYCHHVSITRVRSLEQKLRHSPHTLKLRHTSTSGLQKEAENERHSGPRAGNQSGKEIWDGLATGQSRGKLRAPQERPWEQPATNFLLSVRPAASPFRRSED